MKRQIDLSKITLQQAILLLNHFNQRLNASEAINNMLLQKLAEIALDAAPALADDIGKTLGEYIFTVNAMEGASDLEVYKILGIEPPPHASAIN